MSKKEAKTLNTDDAQDAVLPFGWQPHPETIPEKINKKYMVMLKDGTETEDYFTGFNWYYYDYTEIVAWKPICS